jgi:pimeloyl-ACP methyl ester carboxylesterase
VSTVRSSDGTRIGFDRSGSGPPLILVGGAFQYRAIDESTAELVERLAPAFTVFHYDRRGRGESGDAPQYAVAREVEDLAAVIGAAGGAAAVFGLSSGAALALEGAASGLPITRLALYEPPYSVELGDDEAYVERLHELLAAGRRGDAVEWFLANAGVPPEALARLRSEPEWPEFEAAAPTLAYDHAVLGDGAVPRERAARITAPTLVANGGESPDFFAHAARATAEAIPKAQHRVLEGQAWGRSDPAALAPVLAAFFAE